MSTRTPLPTVNERDTENVLHGAHVGTADGRHGGGAPCSPRVTRGASANRVRRWKGAPVPTRSPRMSFLKVGAPDAANSRARSSFSNSSAEQKVYSGEAPRTNCRLPPKQEPRTPQQ
ncbi:hypothetical protein NDU88_000569 [Pleurodeles waltl]|uniref:Uncharacterized protein n=1 Tax=Pleurodeles waltl TaxID=8319 RepID=A0AAV7UQC4_PLEWA|nr:hypothetical protein NDU88_000569 [Pleurodeles waltl]